MHTIKLLTKLLIITILTATLTTPALAHNTSLPLNHLFDRAIFGNTLTSSTSSNIENIIKGSNFQMGPVNGIADSITARLYITLLARYVKCAIYDNNGNLIGVTEERNIASGQNWQTFQFTNPKPTLTANAHYYLVTWAESRLGSAYLMFSSGGTFFYYDKGYGTYPPTVNFIQSSNAYTASIYCSYTETPNNPPYEPSTPNPANHATNITITPTLSWICGDPDPGDTVTYDVYLGTPGSILKIASNITTTSHAITTPLQYNTQYYWQIVAWDNHGAKTTGPYWDFTTIPLPNNPPNIPTNEIPLNNSINIPINITLQWTGGDPDPSDIITYDIYLDTTEPPSLIIHNHTTTTYTPGTLQHNTTYIWRIRAWDNHDASTLGPRWYFTTEEQNLPPNQPDNPQPTNNETGICTPLLSWTCTDPNPSDTLTYDIYYGTTTPPPKIISNQTTTTYTPPNSTSCTIYYWQITAWDNHGTHTNGPIWHYRTNCPPNPPLQPLPPNNAQGIPQTTILSWNGTDPDTTQSLTYDIYFGTTTPPPKINANQTQTTYNPGLLNPSTIYYWKIMTWDPCQAATTGPTWQFLTNRPPNTPTNPNPPHNAQTITINSDISWTCTDPDPNQTLTYDIYFGTTTPPPQIATNHTTTIYDLPQLTYGTTYYWKIIAWDNLGLNTEGPLWQFTTNYPPNQPHTPQPPNQSTNVSIDTILSWLCSDPDPGDTLTYDIYLGTTTPPPQIINNHTTTTYNPNTLTFNTTYYWKIIAWDNHQVKTTGPTWSFSTGTELNQPPETPDRPNGPTRAPWGEPHTYTTQTTDSNFDPIMYNFSWGDGDYSGWIGPYTSGTTASATHTWYRTPGSPLTGNFEIRVKARDNKGAETTWSDPLPIIIPVTHNQHATTPLTHVLTTYHTLTLLH